MTPLPPNEEQPPLEFSPRKPVLGTSNQNMSLAFSSKLRTTGYDSNAHSRAALRNELYKNLHFDQSRIFDRLGIDNIPQAFVEGCRESMRGDPEFTKAWDELQSVVSAAERTEKCSDSDEKMMYTPLETIFRLIADYNHERKQFIANTHRRAFTRSESQKLTSEVHTVSFPAIEPDFSLLDPATPIMPQRGKATAKYSTLWRYRAAFAEIKASSKQNRPRGIQDSDMPTPLVQQAANYARLHMSARPFQLFSVALLMYGLNFCVAIHDRGGVLFSPEGDLRSEEGWGLFIRIVRRMTCGMSSDELGQDPTADLLPPDHPAIPQLRLDAQTYGVAVSDNFPTYSISMGGTDYTRWGTVAMLWSSLSLIGRGTTIWLVRELTKGNIPVGPFLVMKTSWRSKMRVAESIVYQVLQNGTLGHGCVARFKSGGDVCFPDRVHGVVSGEICVHALRQEGMLKDAPKNSPVLHRFFLSSVGRPIWEYRSEVELLRGIKAAVRGHQYLVEHGIMHRDVSAGNVMLAADGEQGCEGFITDFDYAHIDENVFPRDLVLDASKPDGVPIADRRTGAIKEDKREYPRHLKYTTVSVQHGANITGTYQFMSIRLLELIKNAESHPDKPIKHEVRDDVESFLWVLSYALMRHSLVQVKSASDLPKGMKVAFMESFGRLSVHDIRTGRRELSPLDLDKFAPFVSQRLIDWLRTLGDDLHRHPKYDRHYGLNLTHEDMIRLMDEGIAVLTSV